MIECIKGVFTLDRATFVDIEHDESALQQAAIVVVIVAVLSAIGSGIGFSYAPQMLGIIPCVGTVIGRYGP